MKRIMLASILVLASASVFALPPAKTSAPAIDTAPTVAGGAATPAAAITTATAEIPAFPNANPADKAAKKKINLKVTFNYQHNEKDHHDEVAFDNSTQVDIHNRDWTLIQNSPIVLLGKIEKMTAKTVKIQFLVIDPGKNSTILSQSELVVNYGKKEEMLITKDNEVIQLNVTATS